jgi:DnaJ-domain-containing protein 1
VILRLLLLVALVLVLWRVGRALLAGPRPVDVPRRPGRQPGAGGAWDPWTVLGVARGASRDEIGSAYRELMKRYHPDRVADLGPELQDVAHEKTVEIQRAYDELTR